MKHVTILVPSNAVLASVDDPRMMFTAVNSFLQSAGKEPLFDIQLVGLSKEMLLHGSFSVHMDALLKDVHRTDLIFIPAMYGDLQAAVESNKDFLPWIKHQYGNGAKVVSLCVGAFLLASTGLLDNKKCSTHWMHANLFRNMFPGVELVDDRIVTEENGIYTSGGATAYWNLLLYLVEKYTDRPMAILASKYFLLDMDRKSQSPFIMFKGQTGHKDTAILLAQQFIEDNFSEKITIDQLAAKVSLSRRNFERRFKKATSNTVTEYIQRVKVEAAKKNLETGQKNVSEVMYEVGYSDTKAFRNTFKKVTGLLPLTYRNKYNKEAIAV